MAAGPGEGNAESVPPPPPAQGAARGNKGSSGGPHLPRGDSINSLQSSQGRQPSATVDEGGGGGRGGGGGSTGLLVGRSGIGRAVINDGGGAAGAEGVEPTTMDTYLVLDKLPERPDDNRPSASRGEGWFTNPEVEQAIAWARQQKDAGNSADSAGDTGLLNGISVAEARILLATFKSIRDNARCVVGDWADMPGF